MSVLSSIWVKFSGSIGKVFTKNTRLAGEENVGEIIDIGSSRTFIRREKEKALLYDIAVHPMLLAEAETRDPQGEKGADYIVQDYQRSILEGASARETLRHALVAVRKIR